MEKMIGVINDNLASVIDGIRTHKEEAEEKLNEVNAEIDKKVRDASTYRSQVDNARTSIQTLEEDITTLKKDLEDLKERFGSRNFTEILNAADKEINAKIKEKQASIDSQAEIIKNVTEEANNLKEVLVKLKEKKASIEETLRNARTLYSFYEDRISSIISFSKAHTKDLGDYVRDKDPIKEIDVNQALKPVDGSVFEEIATISTKAPTKEEAEEALDNIIVLDDDDEDEKTKALTTTQQLDDIISVAKDILTKEKEEPKKEEPKAEKKPETVVVQTHKTETVNTKGVPIAFAVPLREPTPLQPEEVSKEIKLPDGPIVLDTSYSALRDQPKPEIKDYKPEDHPVVPINGEEPTSYVNFNDILDKALKDAEKDINPATEQIPFEDAFKDEEPSLNNLNGNLKDELDKITTAEDIRKGFKELNLDAGRFTDSDLEKLILPYNKDNTEKFITVLGKHNIDTQVIYENVDVLIKVTPQNLDKILNILEITGASNTAIEFVYRFFDKININKLEMAIVPGENKELSHVLYDAIPFFTTDNLVERLSLTKQEENMLKDKTTKEEYKRMCMFSDIVFANYVTLRNLGINNLKDCITKHPKRFLWNPDRFNAMLDKYDTDDLIRCINKNSAVLDKL